MCEPMTPRELEVAHLLLEGKCNKLIARSLDISVRTVKAHVTKILAKTCTKTRNEFVALTINLNKFIGSALRSDLPEAA